MGIFDWLKRKEPQGKTQKTAPEEKGLPMGGLRWWTEVPAWSKRDLLEVYSKNNWIYAVVSKIAQAVSSVEWRLYTEDEDGNQIEITEGPIYEVLLRPNKFTSWQELIEQTSIILELAGEVFWVLTLNNRGEPTEIWAITPDRMSIVTDPDDFIKGYVYRYGTEKIPLELEEVIHFKYPNPLDPYRGLSPVQSAMNLIQNDIYSQEYTKAFFYNSAMPSGIITAPTILTPEQYRMIKEQWQASHGGVVKAHRIAVLENGMQFTPISYSLRDLQLTDVRKQNRDDILATFGVHASILGISENVNRANAEASEYTFAKRVVAPRLAKIQQKINAELLPKWRTDRRITFEFLHEIPDDLDATLRKIQTAVSLGLMTINEARNLLGLDDIVGGDAVMQPMNLFQTPVTYEGEQEDGDEIAQPQEDASQDNTNASETAKLISQGNTHTAKGNSTTKTTPHKRSDIHRAIVWKRFVREQRKYEKKLKKELAPIWDELGEEVKKAIKEGRGLEAVKWEEYARKFADRHRQVIKETFHHFAGMGASDVLTMKAQRGIITKEEIDDLLDLPPEDLVDMTLPHILEWIKHYPMVFGQEITETTAELIRKALKKAFENQEDLRQIMERIAKIIDDSKQGYRAERIARTETIRASNKGLLEGYRQQGVRRKEWITAIDERTREWHADANGQIVDLEAKFIVGGEQLAFPGDPNGSPENTINCRCTIAPVLD